MTKGTYLCDISDSALYHGKYSLFSGGSHKSVWLPPQKINHQQQKRLQR